MSLRRAALALLLLPLAACAKEKPPDDFCLTGTLAYDFHDAEDGPEKPAATAPAHNANWELWGGPTGSVEMLSTGRTGADGSFRACHRGRFAEVHLTFRSASGALWQVVTDETARQQYSFESVGIAPSPLGELDLGRLEAPETIAGAWRIVDTLNLLYDKRANPDSTCWTRRQDDGHCEPLTMVWTPADDDEAGYFDQEAGLVVLAGDMPDSEHLILHEAGHWFQWQLYGHWLPETVGCEIHYIEEHTSPTCAWVEGFPDALAAYASGDDRYVYEDGIEAPLDGSTSWATGEAVQGRVAGTLVDLWAPNGPDGGNWDGTIEVMSRVRSSTFLEYFYIARPMALPPLSTTGEAAAIVRGHTIKVEG
ncbi:hypothetical protein AB0I28_33485 [Phytomonospora sp. NPDC050363]|uniref:hypothetical protein n=1 Tax=Phytomonospora sp. NPDC050363 TaxID=3155642 RepID=UPI00340DF9C6